MAASMKAKITFARGPAKPTFIMSLLGSLNPMKLIGTGFAQPITTGEFIMISMTGSNIVPKGSICETGFRVSLPENLAVGSPSL